MYFKFFEDNAIKSRAIFFTPHRFEAENVEFCFQFGDDEPIVFATGPNDCTIQLSASYNSDMIFNDNGRTFKLFARERI